MTTYGVRAAQHALIQERAPLPAWPIALLIGGMPLWWVTGVLPFIPLFTCALLVVLLLNAPRVTLTLEAMLILAFTLWAATCVVMVDTPMRAAGSAIRLSMILGAALILIYVTNSGESLSRRRVLKVLFGFWLFVVFGGFLAVIWPTGGFTTPMAYLLPGGLRENELVKALVQPSFAEVQHPWGAEEPFHRPSAPFAYANGWGAGFAYLTPLAIAFRMTILKGRRRLIDLALLLALVPAVLTSNRGMLLILFIQFLYVAIRMAARGDARGLVTILAATTIGVGTFVALGGLEEIQARQETSSSVEGRGQLYAGTFSKTRDESPIMGFGAPRPAEEIGVAFGTQGAAWTYMFSYGFVGLGLILASLWTLAYRSGRRLPQEDLWVHAPLVGVLVGMWFYGLDFTHLVVIAAAGGLLLRHRIGRPGAER